VTTLKIILAVCAGVILLAVMMWIDNPTHCAIPGYSICSFARCLPTCKDDTARTTTVDPKPWPLQLPFDEVGNELHEMRRERLEGGRR